MLDGRGMRECGLEEWGESAGWKRDIRVLSGRRVRDCWLEERESECCLEEGQDKRVLSGRRERGC